MKGLPFPWVPLVAALAGCPAPSDPPDASDAPDAGSADAGPGWAEPLTIEAGATTGLALVGALDGSGTPALAWFRRNAAGDHDLRVARRGDDAWNVVSARTDLAGHAGASLAFDPAGVAHVAYLGGGTQQAQNGDGRWTDFESGRQLPSDAAVLSESSGNWLETVVSESSASAIATGFAVDDQGGVTGLWPALAFAADGTRHHVFRDVHFGADKSAFELSNLEYVRTSGATRVGQVVAGGRSVVPEVQGAGTWTRLVLVNGEPAVAFAISPETTGDVAGLWFARRGPDGTWSRTQLSAAASRPGDGPSLAHHPTQGFAIAWHAAQDGDLRLFTSSDGAEWLDDTVDALGVTGLSPTVAWMPDGALALLYGFCRNPTDGGDGCPANRRELRFRQRVGGSWGRAEVVANVEPRGSWLFAEPSGRVTAAWRDTDGVHVTSRTP